ncbi:hypothetical protein EYF80_031647 [Liparis tanakae]|uniref:Uncharacterized protein n=1 Tax=Liparis tanakae TaxID=230148 RepID=A0A4Z2GZV0_9TELE|nr:hypothetical protein EYF80_031647 [Liparis tanakae]
MTPVHWQRHQSNNTSPKATTPVHWQRRQSKGNDTSSLATTPVQRQRHQFIGNDTSPKKNHRMTLNKDKHFPELALQPSDPLTPKPGELRTPPTGR